MIVCSFSHTYSITIREASNIIQAGTTIITGRQASISLQGLHSSMESNKLTKILKQNVNLTNYEYPTKPISHTFTVLIYSLKKFQKLCFWGNTIKLSLHCSPVAFSMIEWFFCSFALHLSSFPLSFQVCLACFLFDVFVCIYVYIFILTGLFFCYFTFYLVHFQLSLFALLFIFYLIFFTCRVISPFYIWMFSLSSIFLHTFINFVCFLLLYCFNLHSFSFTFNLVCLLVLIFYLSFVYFLHHTLLSFISLFNSVFCSFFHLFFLWVSYVPFVARLTEPDTFSEQTDHVALLLIGYG